MMSRHETDLGERKEIVMSNDDQEGAAPPEPNEHWPRHWDIVCLGTVTIGTAALGGAVLSSDLEDIVSSGPKFCLAILVLSVYLMLLFSARWAIFSDVPESSRPKPGWRGRVRELYAPTGPKKGRVERVFTWFICELLVLVAFFGLLEAFDGFRGAVCSSF